MRQPRAATLEAGDAPTAVHTCFWGCGAFGGNRLIMALLQVIAAGMARVERLVFHTFDVAGSVAFDSALGRIKKALAESSIEFLDLVDRITAMGFKWSVSDGN